MITEYLPLALIFLVIAYCAMIMRRSAMKDREKLRRPMNSLMFVD